MPWIQSENDVVAQVALCEPPKDEVWEEVEADVWPGYVRTAEGWAAPVPAIEVARASAIALLTADCRVAIVAGFASDALGTVHTYPCGETDQINLLGRVTEALLTTDEAWSGALWCADAAGVWDYAAHSKTAISDVNADYRAHVQAAQLRLAELKAAVAAAATAEDVAAIHWSAA